MCSVHAVPGRTRTAALPARRVPQHDGAVLAGGGEQVAAGLPRDGDDTHAVLADRARFRRARGLLHQHHCALTARYRERCAIRATRRDPQRKRRARRVRAP